MTKPDNETHTEAYERGYEAGKVWAVGWRHRWKFAAKRFWGNWGYASNLAKKHWADREWWRTRILERDDRITQLETALRQARDALDAWYRSDKLEYVLSLHKPAVAAIDAALGDKP